MKTTLQIYLMLIVLIASAVVGVLFMNAVDPFQSGLIEILVFYALVWLFIFCLSTILGFYIRIFTNRNNTKYLSLVNSRRQGILFSFFLIILLFLQSQEWLSLLTAIPLILIFILIEIYLQT